MASVVDWIADQKLVEWLTMVGEFAIAGVIYYEIRKHTQADDEKQRDELSAIRLALRTEIAMIAAQCILEYKDWTRARNTQEGKEIRTALLPPLKIYEAMTANIGRLTRNEIVPLIGFAGTISDIGIVATAVSRKAAPPTPDDKATFVVMFSHACRLAAQCLRALPAPDADEDRPFIEALEEAGRAGHEEHENALAGYGIRPRSKD